MIRYIREHIAVKSILSIILLLMLFSLVVCVIGFRAFTNSLLDLYSEDAFRTADTAAAIVDGDRIDAYRESGGVTEEYKDVYATCSVRALFTTSRKNSSRDIRG